MEYLPYVVYMYKVVLHCPTPDESDAESLQVLYSSQVP